MKRTLSLLVAVLLLIGAFAPAALAAPDMANTDDTALPPAEIEPAYVMIWGTISDIDAGASRIEVEQGNGAGAILLNIDKNTRIVDNVTKKSVKVQDLKKGDTIYAWHSPMMTMSLPPQTYPHALVVNIAADARVGQFYEVEKVKKTEHGYRLLNQQQDLFVTIPANVKIKVFDSRRIIRPSAIKPGMKLMVWYDVAALSYPAQTGTSDLIAFAYDYKGYVSVDQGVIIVNGCKLAAKAQKAEDGAWLVPLRDVAKKLGFNVRWNSRSGIMTLKKGGVKATFTKGAEVFFVNDAEISTLAPAIMNGKLYVELKVLNHLGNFKLATPGSYF